jgi:hypothetical protein
MGSQPQFAALAHRKILGRGPERPLSLRCPFDFAPAAKFRNPPLVPKCVCRSIDLFGFFASPNRSLLGRAMAKIQSAHSFLVVPTIGMPN